MWVLKEPYDEIENGEPQGGGWSIPENCFVKEDAWKNNTWQPIIYIVYALINDLEWKGMDYIRDDKSMADVLKQIAYINVSKMPAKTRSQGSMKREYELWKPILHEQIQLYKPDVIIFGNTFDCFKADLIGEETTPLKSFEGKTLEVYKMDNVVLLSAYHPLQTVITREKYVTDILSAIREFCKC